MNNGWFKVIKHSGEVEVVHVYNNMTRIGSVYNLMHQERCIFEPVHILTEAELRKRCREFAQRWAQGQGILTWIE